MIRKLCKNDKAIYLEMVREFYASDAVLAPVPEEHFERTFCELMRSDVYAEGFILEYDGTPCGYALLAKSFSQEAGGLVIWIEELYIRHAFRGKGLSSEFFQYLFDNLPAARYRLETEPENEHANAVYLRKGFRPLPYDQMILGK